MAVSTTTNKVSYSGDGSQTIFPFEFAVPLPDDLTVILVDADGNETTLARGVHYSLTPANNDFANGGNVVMTDAPLATEDLVIYRILDITQEVDYEEGDSFPAEVHETALDKLTMICQQLEERYTRSIAQPITDAEALSELPPAGQRANMYPHFDANGDLEVVAGQASVAVTPAMEDVVGASTKDEALELLNVPRHFPFKSYIGATYTTGYSPWYLKKGCPVGLVNGNYVSPYAQWTPYSTNCTWSLSMNNAVTRHIKTYTDENVVGNNRRLFLRVGLNVGKIQAIVFQEAYTGTNKTLQRTELCYVNVNQTNSVGGTKFAVSKLSESVWCVWYITTTNTLRALALTFNEGTPSIAGSADLEVTSAAQACVRAVDTWERYLDGQGAVGAITRKSGANGVHAWTLEWSGSAWSLEYNVDDFTSVVVDRIGTFHWGGLEAYEGFYGSDRFGYITVVTATNVANLVTIIGGSNGIQFGWWGQIHVEEQPTWCDCCPVADDDQNIFVWKAVKTTEIGTDDLYDVYVAIWRIDEWEATLCQPVTPWMRTGLLQCDAQAEDIPFTALRVNTNVAALAIIANSADSFYQAGTSFGLMIFEWIRGKIYMSAFSSGEGGYTRYGGTDGKGYLTSVTTQWVIIAPTFLGVAASDVNTDFEEIDVMYHGYLSGLSGLVAHQDFYVHNGFEHFEQIIYQGLTGMEPRYWYKNGGGLYIGRSISTTEMLVGM